MGLTRQDAREVIDTYIRAWESQDPDLIVTIFTEDATYHERILQDPIAGREGIRRYWEDKVVRSQAVIRVELLNLYLDGVTVIASGKPPLMTWPKARASGCARSRSWSSTAT